MRIRTVRLHHPKSVPIIRKDDPFAVWREFRRIQTADIPRQALQPMSIDVDGKDFKFFFSTIFPFLISTGFSTSVILGKSEPLPTLLWGLTVTILMLTVRQFAWNKALKVYTSASS